jgi:hypothetical protein
MVSWAESEPVPATHWLRASVGQAEGVSEPALAIRLRSGLIGREPVESALAPAIHWQEVSNSNLYCD